MRTCREEQLARSSRFERVFLFDRLDKQFLLGSSFRNAKQRRVIRRIAIVLTLSILFGVAISFVNRAYAKADRYLSKKMNSNHRRAQLHMLRWAHFRREQDVSDRLCDSTTASQQMVVLYDPNDPELSIRLSGGPAMRVIQQLLLAMTLLLLTGGHCNLVNSGVQSESYGNNSTAVPVCQSVKDVKKTKERAMTAADKANFTGPAVRDYIRAQHRMPSPGAIVLPPREFGAVVDAGKDAVPFLLRTLYGDDHEIKEAAAQALARITNKSYVDFQVAFGAKQDVREWKLAAAKYREWWEHHRMLSRADWLIEDTASPAVAERRSAVLQLASYDTSKSRDALQKCLSDPDVRIDAARSLAILGDPKAIPVLINIFLSHQNPAIRGDGICLLRSLTGQTFGFDPDAPASSRNEAINKWHIWARQNHLTGENPANH